MTKSQLDRTLDTLVDFADLNRQALTRLTDLMEQSSRDVNASIDRLGDRIDQMGTTLGGKIDDLAAQNSILSDNITRLERTVERQAATADKNADAVAQLVALAQQQAQTVDRMLAVRG